VDGLSRSKDIATYGMESLLRSATIGEGREAKKENTMPRGVEFTDQQRSVLPNA